jgi:hypothetical protein
VPLRWIEYLCYSKLLNYSCQCFCGFTCKKKVFVVSLAPLRWQKQTKTWGCITQRWWGEECLAHKETVIHNWSDGTSLRACNRLFSDGHKVIIVCLWWATKLKFYLLLLGLGCMSAFLAVRIGEVLISSVSSDKKQRKSSSTSRRQE